MSAERAAEWSDSDLASRVDELVRILRAAERELEDLTGGQLDAVAGTGDGALLLRSAQERLRESEARQRELASTQVAIFDALPAHIALLDRAGVIVAVNEAWRGFGAANGLAGGTFAVGESYLAVCDRAEGEGAGEAHNAASGIRRVLAGSLPQFALEYPCHGSAEQRWFRLTVTPVDRNRPGGAVVMHVDTTARRLAEEEIRRSQGLLKMASRLSRLGGWSYDVLERRLTLSEELRSQLGVVEDDPTVGQAIDQFVVPEQHEEILRAFADCVQHGRPYDLELQMRTSEGKEIWTRVIGEAERDAAGRIVRVQGAVQDVSEQLQAREAVRLSEERFRLLANATHDAIWDWGVAAERLWWNDGFVALLGYPQESAETITGHWTDLVHPDDRRHVVGDIVEAFEGDSDRWSHECRFRRADAEYVYVLHRGYAIRDGRGRLMRLVGGMTDLTERHKASERLAEQAALLDAANEAILVKDLDRKIVYWNKGAERIYGWTAEEAIGRKTIELLYEDGAQFDAADRAFRAEGQWHGELRQLTKDGRERIIETSWTLVRDTRGERERVLSINNDVTEERSVQAQLLRAQRLESIGTLAGGIAHDLNNVLTPILMAIEVFRAEETSAARLELLKMIEESVERGAAMVRQVLSFARGVEGDAVPVDLHRVASDVGRIVRETFPKSIAFDLVVQKDLRQVQADPTQIHQVLMNLCVNARDAMPGGGQLSLALANADLDETYAAMNPEARCGSYVSITVADSGVGIAPEHLDRLFEPFFTTKDVGSGTGLGLSTVHTIVRGHGGFVNVYSKLGNGATFRVYLPASRSEQVAARSGAPPSEPPRGEGELILLVDDEESIRVVTRRTLEQFGYRVLLAANGAEAIALFARRHAEIAVVMTDMAMPVMDGYATIVALQTIDPQVRIVASSGLGNERPIARAAGCGVRHFVPKPYSAESLLRTLESALREDE